MRALTLLLLAGGCTAGGKIQIEETALPHSGAESESDTGCTGDAETLDGRDDDCDGLVDCADLDCFLTACQEVLR